MDASGLRSQAAAGDAAAQYRLYAELRATSPLEALSWLQRAADAAFPPAVYELGAAGLAKGGPAARAGLARIEEAGALGFAPAAYHLACLLVHGYGLRRDPERGRAQLLKAVRAADPLAMYAAAMIFDRSESASGREWAFILYQCAAAGGYPLAFEVTASRLAYGTGTSREPAAARFWLDFGRSSGLRPVSAALTAAVEANAADSARAESIAREAGQKLASMPAFEWPAKASPRVDVLCKEPRVARVDDMLSEDECRHLVLASQPHLRSSYVVNPESGQPVSHSMRSSDDAAMSWRLHDIPYYLINRLYCEVLNLPAAHGEDMSVIHYRKGGEYRLHHDYFEAGTQDERVQRKYGGQRLYSMFTYLNDVPAGGETEFPALNLRIAPRRGMAVLFDNCDGEGRPDPRSKHASRPVEHGEKWLAVKWFRENSVPDPFEEMSDASLGVVPQ